MTTIENIKKYLIVPSSMNPRKTASEESIRELAESIAKQGLLQPITVRPHDDIDGDTITTTYEIVCGERRYKAMCMLSNIEEVPCIVREMTDEEALDAMITENLQRVDVDPIEEAEAFRILYGNGARTEDLAMRFGKSENYVRDRIRLTELIHELCIVMKNGLIPLTGAILLSRLTRNEQLQFYEEYFEDGDETDPDVVTLNEIRDWIGNLFMRLWNAPFQEHGNLNETWNPKENMVWQRCDVCQSNTACQNCLFPEMIKGEPKCTNRSCYERKRDFYYNLWLSKYEDKLLKAGEKPEKGRVALIDGMFSYYNDQTKRRIQEWKDRMVAKGYRIMGINDFAGRIHDCGKDVEQGLADGTVIRIIDLSDFGRGARPEVEYMKLKGVEEHERHEESIVENLVSKLSKIRRECDEKIDRELASRMKASDYVQRDGPLEEWENGMQQLMIFRMIPYNIRKELIEDYSPSFEQVRDFVQEHKGKSWIRQAIAGMMDSYGAQPLRRLAMEWIDPEGTHQLVMEKRNEVIRREEDIIEELKGMGFDENGERL